jgi:hypothetical protein
MKIKYLVSLMIFLGLSSLSQAEVHCHTKWMIFNYTDTDLFVQCSSRVDEMQPSEPVRARNKSRQCWGDRHYNDGLGLPPATWTCAADSNAEPLNNPNTEKFKFSTVWGENLRIILEQRDGKLYLSKVRIRDP